jgi:L-aminopeptidase/D-esterase-like protein
VTEPPPLPDGFLVGHATTAGGDSGCTVILCPPGARGAVEARGGGTGTREIEPLTPLANAEGPNAVLLTGGSAFGLAAADGVVGWLEERGRGRATPTGVVPLVPTAVVFDLTVAEPGARPGPAEGRRACEAAAGGLPERGRLGAGAGAAVGKTLGRERATPGGIGYAAARLAGGVTVAAVAVANSSGDVLAGDGSVLGGPRGEDGALLRSAELLAAMPELPAWSVPPPAAPEPGAAPPAAPGQSTTLVCVCTDASLDKRGCGIVARVASAGIARAVDPAFTPLDGDVVFCVASGAGPPAPAGLGNSWALTVLGTVAASVTAAAIRDGVRQAAGPGLSARARA